MCGRGGRRGSFRYILRPEDCACRLGRCSSWYRIACVLVVGRPFFCHCRYCRRIMISIPYALVHDIAADGDFSEKRARRLRDMIHDYRDLVSVIGNPDFVANVIDFNSMRDKEWYEETTLCFQDLLRWLKDLHGFELDKRL